MFIVRCEDCLGIYLTTCWSRSIFIKRNIEIRKKEIYRINIRISREYRTIINVRPAMRQFFSEYIKLMIFLHPTETLLETIKSFHDHL